MHFSSFIVLMTRFSFIAIENGYTVRRFSFIAIENGFMTGYNKNKNDKIKIGVIISNASSILP